MIEFDRVTRTFGRKVAVRDLSLTVNDGELYALLGRNGAGKTTSIKMLVGLLRPDQGVVRVRGLEVAKATQQTNQFIGYVPDEPHLYDKLTGREFLRFVAEMYGMDESDIANEIERLIEQFQLADYIDQLTEGYSYGMKQRTVFASVLVHDPPVLVVDEPMIGLDPHSARLVKDLLRKRAEDGASVLISTHTLSAAEQVADRIGVMDNGQLLFNGTLDALRQRLEGVEGSLEDLYLALVHQAQNQDETLQSA